MHFLLIAYAPFLTPKQIIDPSIKQITFDCFSPQNQVRGYTRVRKWITFNEPVYVQMADGDV
jgi:hypothetical protein